MSAIRFSVSKREAVYRHGSYVLQVSGNILVIDAEGPWDEVAVNQYKRDIQLCVDRLKGDDWAFLGYLHGASVLPPQAEADLTASAQSRVKQGMKVSALIIKESSVPSLTKDQFERIYAKAKVECAFFEEEAKAMEWLNSKGYFLSDDQNAVLSAD